MNSFTFDILLTYFQGPPKPILGPTFDLLEFLGFSGPLGGQEQHKPCDCPRVLNQKVLEKSLKSFEKVLKKTWLRHVFSTLGVSDMEAPRDSCKWRKASQRISETGRIRFRRARFETPSSVSSFCPHRVPGRELSEFLSAYYLCDKANSPSFSRNSPSWPQNSVKLGEFSSPKQYSRNSIPPVS